MRKFVNDATQVATETLEGFAIVHSSELSRVPGALGLVRRQITDKVAVVVGGGSGHEPVWLEYVGIGFADAVCQGEVFAAPNPSSLAIVATAAHRGQGVLFLYGNYSGDRLNFDLAAEYLEEEGISVASVRVADDIAAAPLERREERRGIAGGFFAAKIAGASSSRGDDLETVRRLTQLAVDKTRTLGVASAGGTIPGSAEATFELPPGRMEIGMGMHGEKGVWSSEMLSADATTEKMLELLLADRPIARNAPIAVLVNGLGATTRAELLIVSRALCRLLEREQFTVSEFLVGEYATSQEMMGFSISIFELDSELAPLYWAAGATTFFRSQS